MSSDAPVQVRRAVALMWASIGIGILFTIPALEPIDPEAEEFEAAMWAVMTISFLIPAVLVVFVSRRKNWARIAMLILTIVGIASYLAFPSEMTAEPMWSIASTILVTVLDVVALFWLFSGPGAKWFRSAKGVASAV